MKCPVFGTPYCKSDGQPCTHVVDCRHGWLQFWTLAERAGLKAMGDRIYPITKAKTDLDQEEKKLNREAILMTRAYVQAARKSRNTWI